MGRLVLCLLLASLSAVRAQTDTNAAPAAAQPPPYVSSSLAPSVQQVNVPGTIQSGTQGQDEEIADIRPPFFFLRSWFWLWVALGVIALIIVLGLLWEFFKRKPYISPKSAYDLTLEKLEKARSLLNEKDPQPYAFFISETIRTYLGQRFESPSSRRTTEEFLRLMEKDEGTPLAEHRELLRSFLQSCDMVKFAKYQPTLAELEEVHQRAVTFVTATRPAPIQAQSNGARP